MRIDHRTSFAKLTSALREDFVGACRRVDVASCVLEAKDAAAASECGEAVAAAQRIVARRLCRVDEQTCRKITAHAYGVFLAERPGTDEEKAKFATEKAAERCTKKPMHRGLATCLARAQSSIEVRYCESE